MDDESGKSRENRLNCFHELATPISASKACSPSNGSARPQMCYDVDDGNVNTSQRTDENELDSSDQSRPDTGDSAVSSHQ